MTEQDLLTFQLILKELLKVGFSARSLAQTIHISKSTIYKYLSDARTITEQNYIYVLYQLKTEFSGLLETCLERIGREEPVALRNICPYNNLNNETLIDGAGFYIIKKS